MLVFIIVAPDVGPDKILEAAERVRKSVEKARGPLHDISVSVGCSTIDGRRHSVERLIREADVVMYLMKETKSGRADHYRNHPSLARRNK